MSAPKRWIDDVASATPQERDVLRSGLSVEPPPGSQSKVWLSILAQLPPVPPGGPPSPAPPPGAATAGKAALSKAGAAAKGALAAKGGAAVSSAVGVGILKSALIGAGVAVAVIFTYSAVTPPASTEAPRQAPAAVSEPRGALRPQSPAGQARQGSALEAPTPAPAIEAAPSASPSTERRAPVTSPPAEPRPAAGAPPPAGTGAATPATPPAAEVGADPHESAIFEEGRLMQLAADAYHRGDGAGALAQLEQIQARFPHGTLVLEREVRIIEALARAGRGPEASARAAAFLRAHPDSVLTYRVQPYVR